MNRIIEVEKFEPELTFERTINDIKDNHMKSNVSALMNISAITSFDENFKHLSINIRIEVSKFETEPIFEKNINEIKDNNLNIISSSDMNLSAMTSFGDNVD